MWFNASNLDGRYRCSRFAVCVQCFLFAMSCVSMLDHAWGRGMPEVLIRAQKLGTGPITVGMIFL